MALKKPLGYVWLACGAVGLGLIRSLIWTNGPRQGRNFTWEAGRDVVRRILLSVVGAEDVKLAWNQQLSNMLPFYIAPGPIATYS